MKLYLDENLSPKFRHCFDHNFLDIFTYQFMGWQGKKNGELLKLLHSEKFRGVITSDQLMYSDRQVQEHQLHFLLIQSALDTPLARTPLLNLLNSYLIENYTQSNNAQSSKILVSDGISDKSFPLGIHLLWIQ